MGILRLFLAITVLDWHYRFSVSSLFPDSLAAVCCFFVISGFYMAMVLTEKYRSATGRFWANRALRLYPASTAVLLVLVASDPHAVDLAGFVRQLLVVPEVVWRNLVLDPGTPDAGLIFGQMYTVGLEAMFYAVAPLIATCRNRSLVVLLSAALALHFGLHIWLPARPWQYEFFPGVLVFFLMGVASYRGLVWLRTIHYPRVWGWAALPVFLTYCVVFHRATIESFTNQWDSFGLYVLTALLIPFLFEASRRSRLDRWIGELSYPLYVVQFLIGGWMVGPAGSGTPAQNLWVLGAVLLASLALIVLVERPVDAVRARLGRRLVVAVT